MDKKYWWGRQIVKETDADELERQAALLEFGEGVPREEAEERVHRDYKTGKHREAAAHHLRGLRAAQATGDLEEARRHGEAYHQHMTALGRDSMDQVPEDIKALMEDEGKSTHYKFKAHAADKFLLPDEPAQEPEKD